MEAVPVTPIIMATKPVAAVALPIFVWVEQVPTTALWWLVAVAVPVAKPVTETKIEVEMVAV
jgi:hypothetical protein